MRRDSGWAARNAHRSRLPGRSGLGDYWYSVEEGELYVVSFTDPYPARDPQGFCYTLLLQKKPFRSEADLTNLGESYFDACVRHGIFSDRDTLLSVIAETWCARHLTESGEAVCDKMLDALHLDEELREIGVGDYKTAQDAVAYALRNVYAAGQAAGADAMATMARADTERRRVISEHLASELTLELDALRDAGALGSDYVPHDPKQRAAVERITAPGAVGLLWLDGGPGTGKTLVTKCCIHILRQLALRRNQPDSGVHISASSAKAARRLSRDAKTSHTAFYIPAKGPLQAASGDQEWYQRAIRGRVFLLEEYSMLSSQHLAFILHRLKTVFRCGARATRVPFSPHLHHQVQNRRRALCQNPRGADRRPLSAPACMPASTPDCRSRRRRPFQCRSRCRRLREGDEALPEVPSGILVPLGERRASQPGRRAPVQQRSGMARVPEHHSSPTADGGGDRARARAAFRGGGGGTRVGQ